MKIWLILILLLATILRVYELNNVPPALFGDEVDVGYQAYSLLKTGKDLQGNTWPILIQSLSEYRAPLFIYSAIPSIGILGLNEWGVRVPAAFWGVLGIIGLYLLTTRLFNQKIGILASFFLAISPWHIHYSRAAFEVTMLLTFIVFGVYFFLKGLEKRHYFIISASLFGLTPYIYSTAVVFMPLLCLSLFYFLRNDFKFKKLLLASVFFMVLLLPYGASTISGKAGERFNLISIFASKQIEEKVTILQQRENLPLGLERVFHNKPTVMLQTFSANYLKAFSPEFLFLQGDPNFRQSIHEMGHLYFYELLFLFIGIYAVLVKKIGGIYGKFILSWFLLAPIPASLTIDGGFHATRNFLMLPPLMILLSIGVVQLLNFKFKFKILTLSLVVIAAFNIMFFLHRYFIDYPVESWRAWHYGFKQAIQFIDKNEQNYGKILINNTYEPTLIRFLFWTKYDPSKFHQEFNRDVMEKQVTYGFDGFQLGEKYFFGRVDGPFEKVADQRILFMSSAQNDITDPRTLLDPRVKVLQIVNSPLGDPIFYLITGTGHNNYYE